MSRRAGIRNTRYAICDLCGEMSGMLVAVTSYNEMFSRSLLFAGQNGGEAPELVAFSS
jgi:hypothetical protein